MSKSLFVIFFLSIFSLFAEEEEKSQPQTRTYYPFYTRCEFYYWHPEENGVDYLYSDSDQVTANHGATGDISRVKFTWHSGFRLAAGYVFKPDFWILEASYANFVPNNRYENVRHEDKYMYGTFPTVPLTEIEWATSYISLRCHFADLLLKRKFKPTEYIHLTYFNGMTMAWMKQNWDVYYYDAMISPNYVHVKPLWRFKGGGVKIGMQTDWHIRYGLGIAGRFSASALYGNYDNRINIVYHPNGGGRDVIASTHQDDFRIVTNLNFFLGPFWTWNFQKLGVDLLAAYELNCYFNVHEIHRQWIQYTGVSNNPESRHFEGVLQMHGLTAWITLRF